MIPGLLRYLAACCVGAFVLVALFGGQAANAYGNVPLDDSTCYRGYTPDYPSQTSCITSASGVVGADGPAWVGKQNQNATGTHPNVYAYGGLYGQCPSGASAVVCYFSYTVRVYNGAASPPGYGPTQVNYQSIAISPETGAFCPPNSTTVNGQCRCSPGYRPGLVGQDACVPYDCTAGEKVYGDQSAMAGLQSAGLKVCLDGCKASGDTAYKGADGRWWVGGPYVETGEKCEGSSGSNDINTPPSPDGDGTSGVPSVCQKGQCPGTINGQEVCVPCSSTTTQGTTTTNPDGSKTVTTTECDALGNCKTTTTTIPPDGDGDGEPDGDGTTSTTDEPLSKFCQDNPSSPLCVQSAFAGACSSVTCTGDAVQCAMAREQHRRMCEFFEPGGATVQAGQEAANGQAQPDGHPGANPQLGSIDFGSQIDTGNGGIAGSCPADAAFSVHGTTVTIPWSRACPYLEAFGNFAVAVAMLAAAFIAFRQ